jgi:hypothetical protein
LGLHGRREQDVTKVVVGVAPRARVHVNVKEESGIEMVSIEARFLLRLSNTRLFRGFSLIDVATRLDPYAKTTMPMQNDPSRGNNEGRGRDVVIILTF